MHTEVTITVDAQRRVVALNEAAEALFGIRATDVIGRPVEDLLSIIGDARSKALEEAAAMRDAFLHAVSHELRTPLTVVLGGAGLLADETLTLRPEEATDVVHRVLANAEKLERLLTDLLDLDRLGRGVIEPRRTTVDVGLTVRTVVEYLDAGDHRVDVDVTPGLKADVDGPQLERIVENLVANAIRHCPPGATVTVAAEVNDDGLLVAVDDDGPGVPEEEKERLFRAFERGSASSDKPGTGIGLALVARFAELHGGRAWVEDRPGGGASFRVLLPPG